MIPSLLCNTPCLVYLYEWVWWVAPLFQNRFYCRDGHPKLRLFHSYFPSKAAQDSNQSDDRWCKNIAPLLPKHGTKCRGIHSSTHRSVTQSTLTPSRKIFPSTLPPRKSSISANIGYNCFSYFSFQYIWKLIWCIHPKLHSLFCISSAPITIYNPPSTHSLHIIIPFILHIFIFLLFLTLSF